MGLRKRTLEVSPASCGVTARKRNLRGRPLGGSNPPVYGWFTEGFDTRDLKEAKALLDELNA